MSRRTEVTLPSPGVRFRPDYLARIGRLVSRVAAARERREGAGGARLQGVGTEFVGFRPYRPGEDLRQLDWNLWARTRRPYVRVARREASESWSLLVDTSASMGVGRPGKLQLAAEVAVAITALGLRHGAQVAVHLTADDERFALRRRAGLDGLMERLESQRARGNRGLGAVLEERTFRPRPGRIFLVGDFLDVEPRRVLELAGRGRELALVQILAAEELAPRQRGFVRWVDAESGERRPVDVTPAAFRAYEERLRQRLESLAHGARRHRAPLAVVTSEQAFEETLRPLF